MAIPSSSGAAGRQPPAQSADTRRRRLHTVGLTGLGVGGIIGAGFFLGSGIVIRQVGPLIVVTYLAAGLILAQVMGAITSLAVNLPVRVSYQEYIERFLGAYAGFLLGWAVVVSGVLAIGSEAVAMAVYSRYWAPHVPLGAFAVAYVLVIIGLNTLGVANLGKAETLMSIAKVGVLVLFMAAALWVLAGGRPGPHGWPVLLQSGGWSPYGPLAWLKGMLIVIFSYAGVTTVAMATARAADPARTVPRAALLTTVVVVGLYTVSVGLLLLLLPWNHYGPHRSPFVTALDAVHLGVLARLFNAVILIASFSVMAGTFYATEWMLISLARRGDAPARLGRQGASRPYPALLATAVATLATLVLAFVLPRTVYTDLTAASSYFSFVNWLFILLAFAVWVRRQPPPPGRRSALAMAPPGGPWATATAVAALGAYSVTVPAFRLGFWVFLATTAAITAGWWVRRRRRSP